MAIFGILSALGGAIARSAGAAGGGAAGAAGAAGGGAAGAAAGGGGGLGGGFMKLMKGAVGKSEKGQGIFTEGWQEDMKSREASFNLQKKQARYSQMVGKDAKGMGGGMQKVMKGMAGKAGMMGISGSISSLLRQSQLFTGLIGAIFQVVGAFIDVLLAPFMPGLFKLVALMAKTIPWAAKFSKIVFKILETVLFKPIAFVIGWTIKIIKYLFELDRIATEAISKALAAAWKWISNPSEWWSGPLHPLKKMFAVISGIVGFIVSIIKGVWDWLKGLPFTIAEFFISIKNKLVDIWNGVTGWLSDTFQGTWDAIKTAVDWVGGAFKTAWDGIKDGVKTAIEWVGGAFKTGWEAAKIVFDWIGGAFKTGWEAAKLVFDWLGGTFKTGWNTLKTAFETLKGWVGEVKTIFVDKVKKVVEWVLSTGKGVIINIVNLLKTVGGYVMGGFDTLRGLLQSYIINPLKLAWTWITTKPWEFIKGVFNGVIKFFKNILSGLWDNISGAFSWILDKIKSFLSLDWLKNGLSSVLGFFATIINALANAKILGQRPFKGLEGLSGTLDTMAESLKPAVIYGPHKLDTFANKLKDVGTENTLKITIATSNLGIPNVDSQVMFDKNKKSADYLLTNMLLKADASTSSWWNANDSAF